MPQYLSILLLCNPQAVVLISIVQDDLVSVLCSKHWAGRRPHIQAVTYISICISLVGNWSPGHIQLQKRLENVTWTCFQLKLGVLEGENVYWSQLAESTPGRFYHLPHFIDEKIKAIT